MSFPNPTSSLTMRCSERRRAVAVAIWVGDSKWRRLSAIILRRTDGPPANGSTCVERAGFRIAAEHARHALLVGSAGIDGRGVDRVAGPDAQHWRNGCGKLTVKRVGTNS